MDPLCFIHQMCVCKMTPKVGSCAQFLVLKLSQKIAFSVSPFSWYKRSLIVLPINPLLLCGFLEPQKKTSVVKRVCIQNSCVHSQTRKKGETLIWWGIPMCENLIDYVLSFVFFPRAVLP